MLASKLAAKYAQAIFELAEEKNTLQKTGEQLAAVTATIAQHQELSNLFYHPRVPIAAKKETIDKVFGSEIADFVKKFLWLLVDRRREAALPGIVQEYTKFANEARNIAEAEVTTAVPLSQRQQAALARKLSDVTGKQVVLKMQIDTKILGGVIVKIGDKLIDGSVVRQLQVLKTSLLKGEAKIGVTN